MANILYRRHGYLATALALFATAAAAGPVADVSRTVVEFGYTRPLVHVIQPVFVTNTGDAALNISALSLSGNAADFILGGTCVGPITLPAGGGRCRIDITSNLAVSGPPGRTATLTAMSNASPAIAMISVFATSDAFAPATILTPTWIDFPAQAVGTSAQSQTFTFSDNTTVMFRLDQALFYGGDGADFAVTTDCANLNPGASCTLTIGFIPMATGPRSTELEIGYSTFESFPPTMRVRRYSVTGVGGVAGPPLTTSYEGLWWNSPPGSESGWGINFAHQGDIIFASWFTYDLTGKGLWLVMTAPKTAPGVYSGTLYTTSGPAFNAVPFDPTKVVATQVGTGTITFSDANDATFAYTVNGVSQAKSITREVFGTLPACATATGSLAAATNYQDLWWAAPAASESGWGINLTHEGDTIFATWFTYDLDHTPLWLVVTAPKTAPGVYSGTLYRTTGPAFSAVPFNPANVKATAVGTATFTFSDGNNAMFAYTVNGVSQAKAITREVFQNPGTMCQ